MNNITGYTHFRSYHDSIKDLDKEDKRDILEAIDDFLCEDIEPKLIGFKNSIWMLIKPNLISSKNKSRNYQNEPKKKQIKNKLKSKTNQNEIKKNSTEYDSLESDILENMDMDIEKNKENEKEKNNISSMSTTNIYEFLEQNFGRTITPLEYEKLNSWIDKFDEEMVKQGIKSSVLNGVKKFSYLEAIFRNWIASGYKTIKDVLEHEEKMHTSKKEIAGDLKDVFDYDWLEEGMND